MSTAQATTAPHTEVPSVENRGWITISVMLTTIMQALDTTIANVALPHMQGSMGVTQDQISWVLTSYIVAAAIFMPLTGFLSARMGRKRLFMLSVVGFTITSMLCGAAQSLPQIVIFRLLQGVFGASLVPLSQSVLLDSYPREKHGAAIAGNHRLRRSGNVNDREPKMTEGHTRCRPHPLPVRSAMGHGLAHPANPGGIDGFGRPQMKNACNSAHIGLPSEAVRCGPSTFPWDRPKNGMRQAIVRVATFHRLPLKVSALPLAFRATASDQ